MKKYKTRRTLKEQIQLLGEEVDRLQADKKALEAKSHAKYKFKVCEEVDGTYSWAIFEYVRGYSYMGASYWDTKPLKRGTAKTGRQAEYKARKALVNHQVQGLCRTEDVG